MKLYAIQQKDIPVGAKMEVHAWYNLYERQPKYGIRVRYAPRKFAHFIEDNELFLTDTKEGAEAKIKELAA